MNMETSVIDQALTDFLTAQKTAGATSDVAAKALMNQYHTNDSIVAYAKANSFAIHELKYIIRPGSFAWAMVKVFGKDTLSPLELARMLKIYYGDAGAVASGLKYAYKDMSATAVGKLLLDPSLYPVLSAQAMKDALSAAGFGNDVIAAAVAALYPSKTQFTVQAVLKWQATGISVQSNEKVSINYISGSWTANPSQGLVSAAGNANYKAKIGYTMPGKNEGALIGRIGNAVFLVSTGVVSPAGAVGMLELCINDDLNSLYGVGFSDNRGSVLVEIQRVFQ
jgi:hypothetical protein